MATKLTYWEQLQHPNWQKKRLEIMERDDFACQMCCDRDSQLHVHHKRYVKGRMVWEYEAHELVTLCNSCHESAHDQSNQMQAILSMLDMDGPKSVGEAHDLLAGWATGLGVVDTRAEHSTSLGPYQHFLIGEIAAYLAWVPHLVLVDVADLLRRSSEEEVATLMREFSQKGAKC